MCIPGCESFDFQIISAFTAHYFGNREAAAQNEKPCILRLQLARSWRWVLGDDWVVCSNRRGEASSYLSVSAFFGFALLLAVPYLRSS